MSDSYAHIDPTISAWTEKHGFTLFMEVTGHATQCRTVYVSSKSGECCQIWIDAPHDDGVTVHAADVETRNDAPMKMTWQTTALNLETTLDLAVTEVDRWLNRDPEYASRPV
jgi:hypothetical protein